MAVALDGGDSSAATGPLGGPVQTVLGQPPDRARAGGLRQDVGDVADPARGVRAAVPDEVALSLDPEPAELEHQGRVARLSCG